MIMVEFWPEGIMDVGEDPVHVVSYYRSLPYSLRLLEKPAVDFDVCPEYDLVRATEALETGYASLILTPRPGQ